MEFDIGEVTINVNINVYIVEPDEYEECEDWEDEPISDDLTEEDIINIVDTFRNVGGM